MLVWIFSFSVKHTSLVISFLQNLVNSGAQSQLGHSCGQQFSQWIMSHHFNLDLLCKNWVSYHPHNNMVSLYGIFGRSYVSAQDLSGSFTVSHMVAAHMLSTQCSAHGVYY